MAQPIMLNAALLLLLLLLFPLSCIQCSPPPPSPSPGPGMGPCLPTRGNGATSLSHRWRSRRSNCFGNGAWLWRHSGRVLRRRRGRSSSTAGTTCSPNSWRWSRSGTSWATAFASLESRAGLLSTVRLEQQGLGGGLQGTLTTSNPESVISFGFAILSTRSGGQDFSFRNFPSFDLQFKVRTP
jgi:hypothetical protein